MEKGRIIFLNGVTSSGKTSIVEAIQEREYIARWKYAEKGI